MRAEDKEWKRPFTSGSVVDGLIDWATKIKTLGEVWGAISWHEAKGNGGTDTLERCGETIGSIIADYAEMIEDTVMENSKSFVDLGKNIVFPLTRCKEVYEWSSKNSHGPDVLHIDHQLKELGSFIENAALPAMQLKNAFEDLKKDILSKQKSAPEAVSAAAGA